MSLCYYFVHLDTHQCNKSIHDSRHLLLCMAPVKFVSDTRSKGEKVDVKRDLEKIFEDFRWTIKGIVDKNRKIHPIPKIPQVVTGIFELFGKEKIIQLAKKKYQCKIIEGGSREYPDITLFGGRLGRKKIAVEIKTARRDPERPGRTSRMSLGSCAGYFLHPNKKMAGCRFPYGSYSEHWVVGCIYDWDESADSLGMVSNVEVIVHPKWKIASRSTATGDTAAMGSIVDISDLRGGKGEFASEKEFEDYWRNRGSRYQR